MQLRRRDVVAALAAAGVAVGGVSAVVWSNDDDSDADDASADRPLTDAQLTTLTATAEVLYPSALENIEEFTTGYIQGRAAESPDRARGIANALAYLDEYTNAWFDADFASLDIEDRREALDRMNAGSAEPDPEGSDVERVRYYLINELLFGLYTTPTGGKLVGIENPQGHPGGLGSYQRESPP